MLTGFYFGPTVGKLSWDNISDTLHQHLTCWARASQTSAQFSWLLCSLHVIGVLVKVTTLTISTMGSGHPATPSDQHGTSRSKILFYARLFLFVTMATSPISTQN